MYDVLEPRIAPTPNHDGKENNYCFANSGQFNHLLKLLQRTSLDQSHLDSLLKNYMETSKYPPSSHDDPDRKVVYDFDFIIENQRGMKVFGIPLFSNKTLLPFIDPGSYQHINGSDILLNYNNINNYPLPDLDWKWAWDTWYIFMINDVDDQGWVYSNMFFSRKFAWKGKYYFGNFVRRRVMLRLRYKLSRDEHEPE